MVSSLSSRPWFGTISVGHYSFPHTSFPTSISFISNHRSGTVGLKGRDAVEGRVRKCAPLCRKDRGITTRKAVASVGQTFSGMGAWACPDGKDCIVIAQLYSPDHFPIHIMSAVLPFLWQTPRLVISHAFLFKCSVQM